LLNSELVEAEPSGLLMIDDASKRIIALQIQTAEERIILIIGGLNKF